MRPERSTGFCSPGCRSQVRPRWPVVKRGAVMRQGESSHVRLPGASTVGKRPLTERGCVAVLLRDDAGGRCAARVARGLVVLAIASSPHGRTRSSPLSSMTRRSRLAAASMSKSATRSIGSGLRRGRRAGRTRRPRGGRRAAWWTGAGGGRASDQPPEGSDYRWWRDPRIGGGHSRSNGG